MIRSAPSISTTGPAGPSSGREEGRRAGPPAAGGWSGRPWRPRGACGSTAAGRPRARRAVARHAHGREPWRRRLVSWRPCSVGAVNVEVGAVRTRRDRREFIELPFRLHATSEQWIPPIRLDRKLFHSRRLNAYFKHAEAQEFVARRGRRVV